MNTTEPNELSLDNIQEEVARILTEPKSIMLKERLQREWDAVPAFNLPIDAPADAVAEKALELGTTPPTSLILNPRRWREFSSSWQKSPRTSSL